MVSLLCEKCATRDRSREPMCQACEDRLCAMAQSVVDRAAALERDIDSMMARLNKLLRDGPSDASTLH